MRSKYNILQNILYLQIYRLLYKYTYFFRILQFRLTCQKYLEILQRLEHEIIGQANSERGHYYSHPPRFP